MTNKPTIGSISHGTLKTDDLLEAFADALDACERDREDVAEARAVLTLRDSGWLHIADSDEAIELLDALIDALNEFAPPFCYFGANEGDGSDFGFWPCMEEIEELPRVNDPGDVATMGESCVFVNDHGNMTVYAADGAVILDCV